MIAGSVTVSRTSPPPTFSTSSERAPVVPRKPAERLRQLPQLGQPLLQIAFANAHLDRVAADDRSAGEPNARLPQGLAHVVLHRQELLPAHVVGIDFEQDMRAALQVEPEHDVALRPGRPALDRALGEEVGNGEQADRTTP